MSDMPRPRWPHLLRQVSRHGTQTWVVRKGHGPRIYLRAPYGSPEFLAEYQAAIMGEAAPAPAKAASGTMQWLWEQYRTSAKWQSLSPATKRQRENIMLHVLKAIGHEPISAINRKSVVKSLDNRASKPSAANNFLNTMRKMYEWALKAEYVKVDPTKGVESVKRPKGEGFAAWTDSEIDAFEAHWPVGTRERLALAILLYTGLRRGDAARLGRQHVTRGVIKIKAGKNDEQITIPVLPELAKVIAATPSAGLAFIATATGEPMKKESFGNWFRKVCDKAGVHGKSAHGLRKAGATRAANNGATVNQLEAIFGWSNGRMASLYTRSADRERLAREAIDKLSRDELQAPIPNPNFEVGNAGEKLKENNA